MAVCNVTLTELYTLSDLQYIETNFRGISTWLSNGTKNSLCTDWEMDQSVKFLPYKHEYLRLDLKNSWKAGHSIRFL